MTEVLQETFNETVDSIYKRINELEHQVLNLPGPQGFAVSDLTKRLSLLENIVDILNNGKSNIGTSTIISELDKRLKPLEAVVPALNKDCGWIVAKLLKLEEKVNNEKEPNETSLRSLQTKQPWTIKYSQDFRSNPQPHKDFTHALLHVVKAVGKLQGLADDMDHDRAVALDHGGLVKEYGKYIADLVVCAIRAANVFPGGQFDLQDAVVNRIAVKNEGTPVWVPLEPNSNSNHVSTLREPIKSDPKQYVYKVFNNKDYYLGEVISSDINDAFKKAKEKYPSCIIVRVWCSA